VSDAGHGGPSDAGYAVLSAIAARRSISRVRDGEVPPAAIREMLAAAVAAPNHHLTVPWRFVVLAGDARRVVGEAHALAVARAKPDLPAAGLQKEAARLERAPVVIACACAAPERDDPVQAREDRDAVAAGVQNILLAAEARGLAAMWRTGAMVDEPEVHEALELEPGDRIVAFVYVGLPAGPPPERARPRIHPDAVTTWL
jgi:nitroreductase